MKYYVNKNRTPRVGELLLALSLAIVACGPTSTTHQVSPLVSPSTASLPAAGGFSMAAPTIGVTLDKEMRVLDIRQDERLLAGRLGVEIGDRLVTLNGERVAPETIRELKATLRTASEINLQVERGDETLTLAASLKPYYQEVEDANALLMEAIRSNPDAPLPELIESAQLPEPDSRPLEPTPVPTPIPPDQFFL